MNPHTIPRENATQVLSPEGHVAAWLTRFEAALAQGQAAALEPLFVTDCHWRDLVSLTWSMHQYQGRDTILPLISARAAALKAQNFSVARHRTPAARVTRAGVSVYEGIFSFETLHGRASGLVRLMEDDPTRAWVVLTMLDEIKGAEPPINARRRTGSGFTRNFAAENWLDERTKEMAFADREPAVLIVGAGQAGLMVAAHLKMFGVDTLVVEKTPRVGDVWRNRYHALNLHNETPRNHMPYMPFPPNWPTFLPKDMIAAWFESYAMAMELNIWTGTTLGAASYDEATGLWDARLQKEDGTERVVKPRHIIFANGLSGRPRYANLPGQGDFKGTILHTHQYRDGAAWAGKRCIVLGTGASGHDVAQDLYSRGAEVTMVQRGSTIVTSLEAAHINHALYQESVPLEDSDIVAAANTYPILIKTYQGNVKKMVEVDKALHAGLTARGFKHDQGEDNTGHQMRLRRRGGGYYLNVGCSDLIVDGSIGLLQWEDVDCLVAEGLKMKDGRIVPADLIVTATGYHPPQEAVRDIMGDAVADRVGPIIGIDEDGEMKNLYRRTAQKGLWFMGGGFAQCRLYSKPLALQIKAIEAGLTG